MNKVNRVPTSPATAASSSTNNTASNITRLSRAKVGFQKNLDKRIRVALKHCNHGSTSKICEILWDDVWECLEDINDVNTELRLHTWDLLMELES